MAKIIILNAPPGAGKDTIGQIIYRSKDVAFKTFKEPMFNIAFAMLGRDYDRFLTAYDNREEKEKPQDFLNGKTPREFMIWISEAVMKPVFGSDIFGKRFSDDVKFSQVPIICTDGGFPDEVKILVDAGHEVFLCRLHREGYDFSNDSRDYIHLGNYAQNYAEFDFHLKDGDPYATAQEIIHVLIK